MLRSLFSRSFPRKRGIQGRLQTAWVPAFAGTSGRKAGPVQVDRVSV